MKKNVIAGRMNPPKKGFGAFLKRLTIIPFLLCVVLAALLWLITVNLNSASSDAAESTSEASLTTIEDSVHAL